MSSQLQFRERIRRGDLLVGTFLNLGSPAAVEVAGHAGFDWLLIDLEHGAGTEADLLPELYAASATGVTALVRVEVSARLRLGRALDLGAAGIMVPRLETAEQVREAVSFLRWPPEGVRGVALSTRGADLGGLTHREVAGRNKRFALVVQVENPSMVANAAEVAAIDAVDVLFVGPTDLTHSLGVPGDFADAAYQAALRTVVAAARGAGKSAGILLRRLDDLEPHVELGFRFVGIGSDSAFIADGAAAAVARARSIAS
ncbi:MAG TPA: aldolase/citrate lyase family protein [Candidatus Saccharimonadales bacterium]|nr:aldolase/citrate lyase family protein [Candidatus Saccharimonadales bacterium]